jgi:hypothetical protein
MPFGNRNRITALLEIVLVRWTRGPKTIDQLKTEIQMHLAAKGSEAIVFTQADDSAIIAHMDQHPFFVRSAVIEDYQLVWEHRRRS